ncbi:MAG: Crp/Fnr family transcriptional regulator [Sedimentibacter saalensis]|jgi:CRP-like cAMP-binding protein|uniref:CRP-like cAMP-binding protein n=1 Tax=Sedimentibacter saalensis TaxID=130788 RepID=A0A562J759_9FIRM|nr:Crp/Fnr family transcriptional regulator [Sedimentibacter saalensis]MEA5093741.1 Crp/Fnr family transcriptional regulator [Sedimentibacter saalensis]TWH79006.1 CRP-like cAMP-binding protein [Sedimentibacter saalensis]
MEDIIKLIKDNQLFENINENEISAILKCSKATVESYQENQIVFEKEDTIQKMGIVLEGEFNLVSQKYSGTRVIVTSLEKGDLFGEALIFSSIKKSPYDLVSSGNSKVLLIPYGIFVNMCQEVCNFHKQLISNMLTILSDKIVMLNNKMTILNAETLKGRIALYLLSINKKTKTMTFNMPMNRQELAEFLNVTRPSLSRELSNMQKDGLIEIYRSSVKIKDIERLKELAD